MSVKDNEFKFEKKITELCDTWKSKSFELEKSQHNPEHVTEEKEGWIVMLYLIGNHH